MATDTTKTADETDPLQLRVPWLLLRIFVALVIAWGILEGATIARNQLVAWYQQSVAWVQRQTKGAEIVKVWVNAEEVPTSELIRRFSLEAKLNPIITHAIIEEESNGRIDAIRFEQHVFNRLPTRDAEQKRMLASSHGLMQVMGYHAAQSCHLQTWAELYDRAKNIKCGLKILSNNLKAAKGGTPAERLRNSLKAYNGSGPIAEEYAERIMARIADLLLTSLEAREV